ncbi:MAG: Cof-type HAD-IIB family hydrolase [Erysipelotrichia bacterium]|nr:Cof-type HAD-IIB family hydrolase [Erysipelotrichia bacterium]
MIKVVFFDIDGTLLSHKHFGVSASTRESLKKLKDNGIKTVIATGRSLSELERLPVGDIGFDGYICLNGQINLDENKKIISCKAINGSDKDKLVHLFEQKNIVIMLIEQQEMYINFVDKKVEQAQKAISSEIPPVKEYSGNDFYQAVAFIGSEQEKNLIDLLPSCKITCWNEYAYDIISADSGKVAGIKDYLVINNISQEETMAFGDGENDIEMLDFVEIGVAMGNADEEVKKVADYVTYSVDENGIEHALIKYGLINK